MYIEKRYVKKIEKIFEQLNLDIKVIDASGECLVPEDGEHQVMPKTIMAPGITHPINDLLFRPLDLNPPIFLVCKKNIPGIENILMLIDTMLMNLFRSNLSIASFSDVYRKVLKQELSGAELITRANEQQIPYDMDRTVMLFYVEKAEKNSAYSTLGELVPLGDTDVLIEIDRHNVALIKDMKNIDEYEELYQFAQAIQETLMEEAVIKTQIGIGDCKINLSSLGESYTEAQKAMEVGNVFKPDESIYVFQSLLLERFLMNIPREESMHYHSLLFKRNTQKLFNDEMLQTIEMFFKKDLNLSDTSRQLYIHRNTLVYRLDKILKNTGLDLRKFDDAVTFKILYELKKSGQQKPKQIF